MEGTQKFLIPNVDYIYVVMSVMPIENIDNQNYEIKDLKYPRKIFIRVRFDMNIDRVRVIPDTSLNFAIAKAIEQITDDVRQEAEVQYVSTPDAIQFMVESITSEKSHVAGVAEWKLK